jgi:hypothetical protein
MECKNLLLQNHMSAKYVNLFISFHVFYFPRVLPVHTTNFHQVIQKYNVKKSE